MKKFAFDTCSFFKCKVELNFGIIRLVFDFTLETAESEPAISSEHLETDNLVESVVPAVTCDDDLKAGDFIWVILTEVDFTGTPAKVSSESD